MSDDASRPRGDREAGERSSPPVPRNCRARPRTPRPATSSCGVSTPSFAHSKRRRRVSTKTWVRAATRIRAQTRALRRHAHARDWSGTFAGSMDLLGERIASTVSRALDGAFAKTPFDDVVEHRHEVSGPLRVRVTNGGGKVEVRPGSDDAVVVSARRRSRDPDRARVGVRIEPEEGGVHVSVVGRRRWRGDDGAHLDVRVPATSPVDVTTGGGSIDVADTGGAVSARTGGGGVHVQGVREAHVTTGGGGIVVEALDGEVRAMTGGGSIHVAGRVRGKSSLTTGGGSIHVELDPESEIEVAAIGQLAVQSEIPGVSGGRGHVAGRSATGNEGRLTARTGGGSVVLRRSAGTAGDADVD